MEDCEVLIHDAVESAVAHVHDCIWGHPKLTAAESRLAWLQVIVKLITSVVIDQQSEVIRAMVRTAAEKSAPSIDSCQDGSCGSCDYCRNRG